MHSNPVVAAGPCTRCGRTVRLFDADAQEYLDHPYRGLVHFECPEPSAEAR